MWPWPWPSFGWLYNMLMIMILQKIKSTDLLEDTAINFCHIYFQKNMDNKENRRRKIGQYEVLRTIGKGGFGTVFLCQDIITNMKYAVKEIKDKNKSKIDPNVEIDIHTKLARKKGNRFVKIWESFVENGFVYLVMEYCEEGSLRDYVKKNGPMEVLLATDVLRQLCDALNVMHQENIAHRDLTPSNVLIKEIKLGMNHEVKKISVKVTDFGLSKETPRNARGQFKTTLGTGPFMAPEVKEGKMYTKEADVFSLGSMFYYLLTKTYLPDKQSQFELGPILASLMAMGSVKVLEEKVREYLKAFLRGMLCSEKDRIKLEEIERERFMVWFYTEGYSIDPELREFRSHSQSGPHGRRRGNSRSQSIDSLTRAATRQQQHEPQKRPNKDSALGSDQNSHSSSGRCRHRQIDPESGRCQACPFRLTSFQTTNYGTGKQRNPMGMGFDELLHISEPVARVKHKYLSEDAARQAKPALAVSQPATAPALMRTPPGGEGGEENIYNLKKPPWPFPLLSHDYSAVNEHGRCIFFKYSDQRGHLQLIAILEKTASEGDQSIGKVFELRQNDSEQELQMLEPETSGLQKPEKNGKRIKTKSDGRTTTRIRSQNELRRCKAASEGYDLLWRFLQLTASKVVRAYCEEIANGRKYRLELCMNGWASLYVGPKEARDMSELKLSARQKAEDGPFTQPTKRDWTKDEAGLRADEKTLAEELARALRTHLKQSVWRSRNFDGRNIRCTIYTRGYR